MGTDSRAATPLPLRECKVRASLLLKDLSSSDALRVARATERLRKLPAFARLSPSELVARRESIRHKHALAVIAHEQGFSSWAELKNERGEDSPLEVDFDAFFARDAGVFLNRWFSTYAEALASHRERGGYLFPYRRQFFICEADCLAARGVDTTDPDWERMGRNWVEPLDVAARTRLGQKLIALGYAS
ncbi:hypothetical protein JQX13_32840 [Archangium violaceum]|uniref:hypothetical protein n=1 Tax=Archangium violaceum TaxID=83451 RepID=UPI00193BD179|nr:hypothetical protein [Archangium violaceum]QRK04976.1 hypothetical protein JQX13_32840 [Archangium violaceum]